MSAKNLDSQGRHRSKTVAFRVTPEENEVIDRLADLSGMTKQDYIIHRLTGREVVVLGNPRVHKALKAQMEALTRELRRLSGGAGVSEEMLTVLDYLARIYDGMKTEDTTLSAGEQE